MLRLNRLRDGEFRMLIFVGSQFSRKGLGKVASKLICRYLLKSIILGYINSANAESLNFFKTIGFLKREGGFVSKPFK
jgi:L-amino acid N-acyltransferase YncA